MLISPGGLPIGHCASGLYIVGGTCSRNDMNTASPTTPTIVIGVGCRPGGPSFGTTVLPMAIPSAKYRRTNASLTSAIGGLVRVSRLLISRPACSGKP